jgi:hypothetical protein
MRIKNVDRKTKMIINIQCMEKDTLEHNTQAQDEIEVKV